MCVWCGSAVVVGETYRRYTGLFDGKFQSNATHSDCYAAMEKSDPDYLIDGFSAWRASDSLVTEGRR